MGNGTGFPNVLPEGRGQGIQFLAANLARAPA